MSRDRELPEGPRRLLLGPIDSFEKLEAAVSLGAEDATPQSLLQLAGRSGMPAAALALALDDLAAAGLLERLPDRTWRAAGGAKSALAELAGVWTTDRALVLETLTQRALGRIRASAARAFADAFTLRRNPKDDGDDHG